MPGRFLILTNDGATNFRIVSAPEDDASPAKWRDWQPASDSVFIEGARRVPHARGGERAGGRAPAAPQSCGLADNEVHFVTFPDPAYGVFPMENHDFDAPAVPLQLLVADDAGLGRATTI